MGTRVLVIFCVGRTVLDGHNATKLSSLTINYTLVFRAFIIVIVNIISLLGSTSYYRLALKQENIHLSIQHFYSHFETSPKSY